MFRRKFLALCGIGTASIFALPSLGLVSNSFKRSAVGIIMNELKFLKIDQKGVEQFVDDYFKIFQYDLTYEIKVKCYYMFEVKSDRSSLVADLGNYYLLSTDFFRNKMDESMEVKYIGLYNPYKIPCSNPFSNVYYPKTHS